MPDECENEKRDGRPSSRRGNSAFPKLRLMVLQILSLHFILDIDYAPYCGQKTGERTLMMNILRRFFNFVRSPTLFLMDAGLYSFDALLEIKKASHDLIAKVSSNMKLSPIKYLPDGSYLALVPGFNLNKVLEIVKDEFNQTKQKRLRKYKTKNITLHPAA